MDTLDEFRQKEQNPNPPQMDFVALQDKVRNGDPGVALETLHELLEVSSSNPAYSQNVIIDAKDLYRLCLSKVDLNQLLLADQAFAIIMVNNAPAWAVDIFATRLKSDPSRALLGVDALAVGVALTRRLHEIECTESVSLVVAPHLGRKEILAECVHSLSIGGEEQRFSVYQTLVVAVRKGNYSSEMEVIVDHLVKELGGNDCMVQLNALETLSDLIEGQSTVTAALVEKCAPVVYGILQSAKNSPDGGFLYSGTLRFMASVCGSHWELCSRFPDAVSSIIASVLHFDSLDASMRCSSFDYLAILLRSKENKEKIMEKMGEDTVKKCMRCWKEAIHSGPVEMRERHIQALTFLIEKGTESSISSLFCGLGVDFPRLLVATIVKPFPELRRAIYSLFLNLLSYEYGVKLLISTPEFVDWLCPYSGQSWADSQSWTAVCSLLTESPHVHETLKTRIRDAVKEHLSPKAPQPQVAIE